MADGLILVHRTPSGHAASVYGIGGAGAERGGRVSPSTFLGGETCL